MYHEPQKLAVMIFGPGSADSHADFQSGIIERVV
jgi:hypothetical protein